MGFKPKVVDFADVDPASLARAENLLVVAATWGEGDPPARAVRAYAGLMADATPRIDGVRYGVLALGDTSYAEFCAVGRRIDERLEALGGLRVIDRVDCDLDYEEPAATWIAAALQTLRPATIAATAEPVPAGPLPDTREVLGEVLEHVNLNSSRSDKETIHLALGFDGPAPAYEPGDSLELHPENDPALVEQILAATGLTGDGGLHQALLKERDVTTLSPLTIDRLLAATGHSGLHALVAEGDVRSWVAGRQMIDLLEAYPAALTAEQLIGITRKLPPRAYSIASSRKDVGNEAHLLIAAVRYTSHDRARAGVASVHASDRLRSGSAIRTRLKANPHFRLPQRPWH